MARIQEVTGECFKKLYDFIQAEFSGNEDVLSRFSSKVFDAERNVMLELIKRDAVEKVLTERVLLYAEGEIADELHGASV